MITQPDSPLPIREGDILVFGDPRKPTEVTAHYPRSYSFRANDRDALIITDRWNGHVATFAPGCWARAERYNATMRASE